MSDRIREFEDLGFLFKAFLGIGFDDINADSFDRSVPVELRKLYGVRQQYSKIHTGSKLFNQQDDLIEYQRLNLSQSRFDFIIENQGNWTLQTEKSRRFPKVYIDDDEVVSDSLADFLVTYSLQELTFSRKYVDYDNPSLDRAADVFGSAEPLWTGRKYVQEDYLYNYYLIDGDCLFMEVEDYTFFATQSEIKFRRLSNPA